MKNMTLIPVTPGNLNGQMTQLVDARLLHCFLEVRRDFSNWIKGRIQEYGFIEQEDYITDRFSPNPAKTSPLGGRPNVDYFLALDMAKELAMVERTPRGRQARRYFIECEHQLRRLQQVHAETIPACAVQMSRAQQQAINRQAWADVAGQAYAAFHARREELLRQQLQGRNRAAQQALMEFNRPVWAR